MTTPGPHRPGQAGAAPAATPDLPAPDAHLRAALRHAPDAAIPVPPLLKARIVAAALREAEARGAAANAAPWHRRWAESLRKPWRLGGAGTLAAALLAATVLWVGRDEPASPPAPEAMLERSAAPAAAGNRATPPGAAPGVATPPAAAPAPVAEPSPLAQRAPGATPASAGPLPAASARPAAPRARDPAAEGAGAVATRSAESRERRAAAPAPGPADSQRAELAAAAPTAEAAGTTATPGPAAAAVAPAVAAAPSPFPATAPARVAAVPRTAAAEGTRPAPGATTVAAASAPIAERWQATAGPWQWRAADGTAGEVPAGWLRELAAATASRWHAAAGMSATGGGETGLLLMREGVAQGRVAWAAGALGICDAAGRCESAPLDAATWQALRARLGR